MPHCQDAAIETKHLTQLTPARGISMYGLCHQWFQKWVEAKPFLEPILTGYVTSQNDYQPSEIFVLVEIHWLLTTSLNFWKRFRFRFLQALIYSGQQYIQFDVPYFTVLKPVFYRRILMVLSGCFRSDMSPTKRLRSMSDRYPADAICIR